ncbi:MAG: hypothetical protein NVSMB64_30480 [Candidatus Velthaea sp.]
MNRVTLRSDPLGTLLVVAKTPVDACENGPRPYRRLAFVGDMISGASSANSTG